MKLCESFDRLWIGPRTLELTLGIALSALQLAACGGKTALLAGSAAATGGTGSGGDTSAEQLVPLLLDLSAMALRLDKPLTARLMPIPGKAAGDATSFDFSFFANSRVMALEAQGVHVPLASAQAIPIPPRRKA